MFLFWLHSNRSSKIKTKSTSHTSSYFRHYSSHHSSLRSLTHGARTPHSPGSSRRSYWAGYLPRTCSRTRNANTNSPKTASTRMRTAKWWLKKKSNPHVVVSGVPSTHFHRPSDLSSVSPIHTSLSLPNKLLMKFCQRKCGFNPHAEQRSITLVIFSLLFLAP